MTEPFFEESREQSQVKSRIVQKYFRAWAKIITAKTRGDRIAYIDLFAGPGRYKDGTVSTPLLILERAIVDPAMRMMLVTMFNDRDENNTRSLESAIDALPGVSKLRHKPEVFSHEVGREIVEEFEKMKLVPTLMFVDPWGYRGLSLRLELSTEGLGVRVHILLQLQPHQRWSRQPDCGGPHGGTVREGARRCAAEEA